MGNPILTKFIGLVEIGPLGDFFLLHKNTFLDLFSWLLDQSILQKQIILSRLQFAIDFRNSSLFV